MFSFFWICQLNQPFTSEICSRMTYYKLNDLVRQVPAFNNKLIVSSRDSWTKQAQAIVLHLFKD